MAAPCRFAEPISSARQVVEGEFLRNVHVEFVLDRRRSHQDRHFLLRRSHPHQTQGHDDAQMKQKADHKRRRFTLQWRFGIARFF